LREGLKEVEDSKERVRYKRTHRAVWRTRGGERIGTKLASLDRMMDRVLLQIRPKRTGAAGKGTSEELKIAEVSWTAKAPKDVLKVL